MIQFHISCSIRGESDISHWRICCMTWPFEGSYKHVIGVEVKTMLYWGFPDVFGMFLFGVSIAIITEYNTCNMKIWYGLVMVVYSGRIMCVRACLFVLLLVFRCHFWQPEDKAVVKAVLGCLAMCSHGLHPLGMQASNLMQGPLHTQNQQAGPKKWMVPWTTATGAFPFENQHVQVQS